MLAATSVNGTSMPVILNSPSNLRKLHLSPGRLSELTISLNVVETKLDTAEGDGGGGGDDDVGGAEHTAQT